MLLCLPGLAGSLPGQAAANPRRVYVAYDDANEHFPMVCSPTPFKKTNDKITINGRPHTIYRSEAMNCGELTYLGSNNWTGRPPANANNYVVFVQTEGARLVTPVNP